MEKKESFSTSEVARYCHVTADTIRKWAEAGRIQVFKTPGGHRRIRRDDLLRFLRENSIPIHPDLNDGGVKVLVVDAERTVATLIQRFLDRAQTPVEVAIAVDGFDAGRQIAHFMPDIVFLDLQLMGADAYDICRRIKSTPQHAGVRIIGMAASDNGTAERVLEYGATSLLKKPFTPDDLRRVLAKVGVEIA